MDALLGLQDFVLDKFIPFVILLGLLIFVHELGHFLVAKWCKVRVEVFSLGFGKKILQFQRGYTTYCISLIPLGGYVKMYGDDPTADIPEEDKAVSFSHKPVGQRIAIVLAGPLMNFFFAIILFMGVAMNGEKMFLPKLGDIAADSDAAAAGFQSGDLIKEVNGFIPSSWQKLSQYIAERPEAKLNFTVERNSEKVAISANTERTKNTNPFETTEFVGSIAGFAPNSQTSRVGVVEGSLAYVAGLRSFDQIIAVNGTEIKHWRQLESAFASSNGEFKLKYRRQVEKESQEGEVVVSSATLSELGLEKPDLYIAHISEEMPAANAGLKKGDRILKIGGKEITEWPQVIETVNGYKLGDASLGFVVRRGLEELKFEISPKPNTFMDNNGKEITRFQVGIGTAMQQDFGQAFVYTAQCSTEALIRGWDQTLGWTETICVSFLRMLQNEVSPKNIGGILTIGQVASETFKLGLSPYLKIMAIISINLFILNLLPIPILDGGHLLFFTIEALRGAPLSMKKLEIAQQVGLIILMSLMAFALFNDIVRFW